MVETAPVPAPMTDDTPPADRRPDFLADGSPLADAPTPVVETPDLALVDDAAVRTAVWARVTLARNVRRPHTLELIRLMAEHVVELHGDRLFRDDPAVVGGFATIDGREVVFVGHQKGAETDENIRRNFGLAHPEGFRKAMRLFELAERLGLPVVTFVDTQGAFPGAASEERGVAEAIARSIQLMTRLRTPIVTVILGEGGSGGALAIGAGDVVVALENAIYSVISPEGCASILWRDPDMAQHAAVAMRITAAEQAALGVVDEVIVEPGEGAHTDHAGTAERVKTVVSTHLAVLAARTPDDLVEARYQRYRAFGAFATVGIASPATRPERMRIVDRLRQAIEQGRERFVGPDGGRLRPQAADETPEPPLREEI
jgi:acetyl-CoA carboxylase carboxyl transferase subunit alpha